MKTKKDTNDEYSQWINKKTKTFVHGVFDNKISQEITVIYTGVVTSVGQDTITLETGIDGKVTINKKFIIQIKDAPVRESEFEYKG